MSFNTRPYHQDENPDGYKNPVQQVARSAHLFLESLELKRFSKEEIERDQLLQDLRRLVKFDYSTPEEVEEAINDETKRLTEENQYLVGKREEWKDKYFALRDAVSNFLRPLVESNLVRLTLDG